MSHAWVGMIPLEDEEYAALAAERAKRDADPAGH
jgi:hypothetical protein